MRCNVERVMCKMGVRCVTGRNLALDGREQNPTSIAILSVLCSTTGRLDEQSGVMDKINLGFEFKPSKPEQVVHNTGYRPASRLTGHSVTRERSGSYLVANLNFFERLAARVLGNLLQVVNGCCIERSDGGAVIIKKYSTGSTRKAKTRQRERAIVGSRLGSSVLKMKLVEKLAE
ncbi:hypothetical protein KIN20_011518 [Parelaphostrongylus tenuis]|uniref:Uncharacterized protein n=1 Tax=Parelaphostrongylus tenuis TaxID=148309 RepID=A0AAD5M9I2_PARTN|nr:hypothetical protein KIN20_011518 [Parelaphostrongylus tenuis]